MQPISLANSNRVIPEYNQKQVAFTSAAAPDLDSLKAKQDEFQRMASQADSNSFMGKIGKLATKAITVAIAFTAMKICLGKVAGMITGTLGKVTDKAMETVTAKAGEKATGTVDKVANVIDKVKKSNIDKYIVNTIAGGAAIGVAMKEFGFVKKKVATDDLVDKAVDKAQDNGYNSSSSSDDFTVSDDEF